MNFFSREKNLLYFIRVFVSGVVAVLLIGVTSEFFDWPLTSFQEAVRQLAYVPFFIVILIFVYDRLGKKFIAKNDIKTDERTFLMRTSKEVKKRLDYGKEEFEKLQADEKFQTFYQDTFTVFQNGENETLNFDLLSNRFSEQEFAHDAAQVVVEETKKLMREQRNPNTEQSNEQ